MKLNKIVVIVLFSFVLIGCKEKKQKEEEKVTWSVMTDRILSSKDMTRIENKDPLVIDVDKLKDVSRIDFADNYIKEAKYIPLRKKGVPIGEVDYMLIYKERLFILDTYKTIGVYIFDLEGNFLANAGRVGQGPGEYFAPEMISILEEEGKEPLLAVCDRNLYMYYYTLDGEFVRREKRFVGGYGVKMGKWNVISESSSFDSKNTKEVYQLLVTLKDSVCYKAFRLSPLQYGSASSQLRMRHNNDKLFFKPLLSDTIYNILSDSTYIPHIIFQHENTIWKEKYLERKGDPREFMGELNLDCINSSVCETSDVVSFELLTRHPDRSKRIIIINFFYYDKRTKEVIRLSEKNKDNLVKGKEFPRVFSNPINVYGDYFMGLITPEVFDGYREVKEAGYTIKDSNLDKILEEKDVDQAVVLYKM